MKNITTFTITTDKIDLYPNEEIFVLNALGHSEALVTDFSTFGDFIYNDDELKDQSDLNEVSKKLGFKIELNESIVSACERLRN